MNLKTHLRNFTGDAKFLTKRGVSAQLRLTNFQKSDRMDDMFTLDSYGGWQGILKGHCKRNVETWLKDNASGHYTVDECYDSILVSFSRDTDAVMYKLGGPYA